jgi:antitoxin component YwqK of YwqJK toxin-antitoxin module
MIKKIVLTGFLGIFVFKSYGQLFPDTISIDTVKYRQSESFDSLMIKYKVATSKDAEIRSLIYSNGQKATETPYLAGEIHGTSYRWHRTGELASKIDYCVGLYCGEFSTYFKDGSIESKADFFDKDTSEIKTYYESGKIGRIEISKADGELIGKRYSYYENGQLSVYQNLDFVIDSLVYYHPNGKILKKGQAYRAIFPCGKWFYKNEDGFLTMEGYYRDCNEDKSYDKVGEWRYYSEGKLERIEFYDLEGKLERDEKVSE